MTRYRALTFAVAILVGSMAAGCGDSAQTIVVGSLNSTEQILVSEIVAQHLEHSLGRKVKRRPHLGGTLGAYQALLSGEISLYPENAGSIVTEILKEAPGADASLILERAKGEMKRLAQAELLNPLGMENSFVVVIRADDPRAGKVSTLDDAAEASDGWILGVSSEFQQVPDGMAALTKYKLPLKTAPRSMDGDLLFKALEQRTLTMIVEHNADGVLTQTIWKKLSDDRHFFVPNQTCLLVRQNLLLKQTGLRQALEELSGKFTTEKMRQMNALVDLGHLQPRDVAASFLSQAGLR